MFLVFDLFISFSYLLFSDTFLVPIFETVNSLSLSMDVLFCFFFFFALQFPGTVHFCLCFFSAFFCLFLIELILNIFQKFIFINYSYWYNFFKIKESKLLTSSQKKLILFQLSIFKWQAHFLLQKVEYFLIKKGILNLILIQLLFFVKYCLESPTDKIGLNYCLIDREKKKSRNGKDLYWCIRTRDTY